MIGTTTIPASDAIGLWRSGGPFRRASNRTLQHRLLSDLAASSPASGGPGGGTCDQMLNHIKGRKRRYRRNYECFVGESLEVVIFMVKCEDSTPFVSGVAHPVEKVF